MGYVGELPGMYYGIFKALFISNTTLTYVQIKKRGNTSRFKPMEPHQPIQRILHRTLKDASWRTKEHKLSQKRKLDRKAAFDDQSKAI